MILVGLLKKSCFNFCWKSKFEGREINCKNPLDSSPNKSRLLYSRVVRQMKQKNTMKAVLAHFISDQFGADIYKNYSGRRMYGETTTGVVLNKVLCPIAFGQAILDEADRLTEEDIEELRDSMSDTIKCDNMGTGYIYY
jgi:hypothetical protein